MESTHIPKASEQRERSRAFGSRFRAAREAAGTSVQALAQSTRISASFIEALEEGAFEKLPGEVFGRGFVRSICKALNLDAEAMLATFDECWDHTGPLKSVLEVEIKEKPFQRGTLAAVAEIALRRLRPGSSLGRLAGVALAMAVLVAGGWQVSRLDLWKAMRKSSSQAAAPLVAEQPPPVSAAPADKAAEPVPSAPKTVETSPVAAAPEAGAAASATASLAETPPAAASLAVESEGGGEQRLDLVVTESVRVRADVDGGGSQTKEYAPGTYQIQFKDKVEMMIYDAAALKISFNGKPLGSLGNKGRVRRISFQSAAPTTKKL